MKILISGGGTGGHIYPALAVAAEIKSNYKEELDFQWIGNKGGIEESLVPEAGINLTTIEGGGLVGISWPKRIQNFAKLMWSTRAVSETMKKMDPDVLFMTGGYVNLPVALVSKLQKVRSLIYLPDIEPALSIKTLSRFADVVACTAEPSVNFFPSGKAVVTGYPVRRELVAALELNRRNALELFDLKDDRQTIFIFGGSRGARSINRAVLATLSDILQQAQIIHITGTLDWPEVSDHFQQMSVNERSCYRPYAYLKERMGAAFKAANLVVSRAGASILGECPAFGLPSILVPYPHAWRYQKVNADYLVSEGAAVQIRDEELAYKLVPTIQELISDSRKLEAMSEASRGLALPDSTTRIADIILDLGQRNIV